MMYSGFFNGAGFFNSNAAASVTAGVFFMLMGAAWFIATPVAIFLVIMVRTEW